VPVDPFFNINTPEDAAEAERIAVQHCDDGGP
jgi:molybdopterin-guanine dinucleotide biosynthesis protein A